MQFLYRFIFLILFLIIFSQEIFAAEKLHIRVIGITGASLKNVQDRLDIEQKLYDKDLSASDIKNFYEHAPANIRIALQPYGYFKSSIYTRLTQEASTWTAVFRINPGPQVFITGLDLQIDGPGKDNPAIQEFIHHFPLKISDAFLTEKYESAKTTFFQVVNNQGYLKAILVKKEVRIDLAKNTVVIILHMDSGLRYYFGSVSFDKSPFAPRFLQRFVPFHPNEPFSSQKILKFQQDLMSSRYFREVVITPEFDRAQNFRVPTQVQLSVPKEKQYKFGAGYGTFTGPRILFGMDWRRIGDEGQHFTALLKWSPVLQGIAAKYFIPGANPLTDQYTFGANIQEFKPQNGESFSEAINAAYLKMIGDWQHSFTLNLLNERYSFNDQPRRNSHELYPSYNVSRIVADNLIDPHSGKMLNFTLQGSNERIFSTTSFIQSELKAKYIFSPTSPSRVILRGDLGYTVVNDLNQLPLTLQYLVGGPGSIRGYNYGSIGPGRYIEIISAEYQHRIVDNLYGALFYDIGTATNKFNTEFKRGDGLGFVYISSIGPIQIYLTHRETGPIYSRKIIFSIGPDF